MMFAPLPTEGPAIVCDDDLSAELAELLLDSPIVAVDTETSGLDWKADSLQLCQLHSPLTGSILVRPGSSVPLHLSRILRDDRVVKVFHFAPFDLRFLYKTWGVVARNVKCTKTAHKLLYPQAEGAHHSLSVLVREYLGVEMDKGAVRTSDWGASHLSDEQLLYAARDVAHLIPLLEALNAELRHAGISDLFAEVCRYLPTGVRLEVDNLPNPFDY
jgi:ribonuclease D